jgi:UDP-glucose 4-epimerase
MKNVAITGIGGYLGGRLLHRLEQEGEVERIVGIDVKEPGADSSKLKFYRQDVREPFADIFADNQIDTALHLAFQIAPIHDEAGTHSINIQGSQNFLEACKKASVSHLFYMSSYSTYGAHADNPESIPEDAPLRPTTDFHYPMDKAKVDTMFQDFMAKNPDTCVTIVRTVTVTGPHIVAGGLTILFTFTPVMIRASGHDPQWQFIHEDDLVELVTILLKKKQGGVFNVAGEDGLRYTEMIKAVGKRSIALPAGLLSRFTRLSWQLHLQSSSPGGVEMLKYPIVVNTEKVLNATGYKFRYSGPEAFASFLETLKKMI